MNAIRIHHYGGPEALTYEEAPRPVPGEGDVLVRVHATSVNPVDWKIREGYLQKALPYPLPMIPGWDVSGIVEALGPGVSTFAVGDAVYGRPDIARDGAYAEYMVARAHELALKPATLDHVHAAAVPLAGLTAWQALFDAPAPFATIGLTAGQTILIHGGAGGVGTFAVQLAKWRGAKVIATASSKNAEFLRDLGADTVIDYKKHRFEDLVHDVDAVFDTIGGDTQARSWKVLKKGGTLLSIASAPSADEAKAHDVRAAYVFVQPSGPQLVELAKLLDAKTIKPVVSEVFPLHEARKAQEHSQKGHVRGKIVLKVVG